MSCDDDKSCEATVNSGAKEEPYSCAHRDDFTTADMRDWLVKCGAITIKMPTHNVLPEHFRTAVRSSKPDSDDEGSDFSD